MSDRDKRDRWNRVANIAIVVTLAFLLLNPSGVVGRWIGSTYRGWDEQRRVSRNWNTLVEAPSRLGQSSSGGVIVEFIDYECEVCRRLAPAVLEAVSQEDLTVVVRHVPSNGGAAATEAALAAICAEKFGLFREAHESLLADQTWLDDRDWTRFAQSLGISDFRSYVACMGGDESQNRLARDVALASILEIPGTPTFVSERALHPGDLAAAVAAVAGAPDPGVQLLVPGVSTFDTSEHPDLADALSFITAGFFLPGDGLALVERTEVHFVNMASGEIRGFGREGGGPREFGRISRALRGPQGIALWDILRRRVVSLDHDGAFLRDLSYQAVPFKGSLSVPPVAVHRDGRIVFGDSESRAFGDFRGRTWDSVEYVAVNDEGKLEIVAQTKGYEHYYGTDASGGVLFGHRSLMAASADHFVIAETDQEAIQVFRWDGSEVGRIPMPPPTRVSANQLRVAREYMAAMPSRHAELLSTVWSEEEMAAVDASPLAMNLWPANELAPPIDSVFIDFDKRLWVRDYHFTDQDSVTWRAWDLEPATALFRVRLDADERLLDAKGDVVLLRRTDELDVPRAVVSRVVAGNEL